jgi:hypothetical protein
VLIKNILTFIFSAVLIDFDRQFIDSQGLLYVSDSTTTACLSGQYNQYSQSNTNVNNGGVDFTGISVSLAKGELAASVIMLVSSLVFVGIYVYVYIRALHDDRNMPNNGMPFNPHPPPRMDHDINRRNVYYQPGPILCENCRATVKTGERF